MAGKTTASMTQITAESAARAIAGSIGPAESLNQQMGQIYPIVNSVFRQMTGRDDITAVDTQSLVAMGQELENLGKLDMYLNTLSKRIGYTIDGYRIYNSKFSVMARTEVEWGAAVQKIDTEMPDAVEDKMWEIGKMDGQSVDQYIISNPKAHQKIFEKNSAYSFFITTALYQLRDAFLSEGAMNRFMNQIFGKTQNKIEVVHEDLARLCVANYILNMANTQHFHLVTIYNSMNPPTQVTTQTALFDAPFLRFVAGFINNVSRKMETMSILYNKEGKTRFTPRSLQNLYMIADFVTQMETVSYFGAYNPKWITADPDIVLPYWQSNKSPKTNNDFFEAMCIKGTADNKVKTVQLCLGILFDWEAMGTFRKQEMVLTTPVNARAAYYNTFWHERQMWFNDMGENAVAFFLD